VERGSGACGVDRNTDDPADHPVHEPDRPVRSRDDRLLDRSRESRGRRERRHPLEEIEYPSTGLPVNFLDRPRALVDRILDEILQASPALHDLTRRTTP